MISQYIYKHADLYQVGGKPDAISSDWRQGGDTKQRRNWPAAGQACRNKPRMQVGKKTKTAFVHDTHFAFKFSETWLGTEANTVHAIHMA